MRPNRRARQLPRPDLVWVVRRPFRRRLWARAGWGGTGGGAAGQGRPTSQPASQPHHQRLNRPTDAQFDTARLELVAVREIAVGEEMAFFYPATEWNMSSPFKWVAAVNQCTDQSMVYIEQSYPLINDSY